jgi:hypothetical protein
LLRENPVMMFLANSSWVSIKEPASPNPVNDVFHIVGLFARCWNVIQKVFLGAGLAVAVGIDSDTSLLLEGR